MTIVHSIQIFFVYIKVCLYIHVEYKGNCYNKVANCSCWSKPTYNHELLQIEYIYFIKVVGMKDKIWQHPSKVGPEI